MLNKVQSKRLVFMTMAISYIGLTVYEMVSGTSVPSAFVGIVSGIVGHYFGFDNGQKKAKEEIGK